MAHSGTPRVTAFLTKLYDLVSCADSSIVRWGAAGDSLLILKPKDLAKRVLPSYYKHNNYSSFTRQLNFYGFKKAPLTEEEKASLPPPTARRRSSAALKFCHPCFRQGRPELLSSIRRRTNGESKRGEVAELRAEVCDMRSALAVLQTDMRSMQCQLHRAMALLAAERRLPRAATTAAPTLPDAERLEPVVADERTPAAAAPASRLAEAAAASSIAAGLAAGAPVSAATAASAVTPAVDGSAGDRLLFDLDAGLGKHDSSALGSSEEEPPLKRQRLSSFDLDSPLMAFELSEFDTPLASLLDADADVSTALGI